jgi:hypothetical protein
MPVHVHQPLLKILKCPAFVARCDGVRMIGALAENRLILAKQRC